MVNTAKHINKESVFTELVLVKQALQLTVVLYKSCDVLKITKEIKPWFYGTNQSLNNCCQGHSNFNTELHNNIVSGLLKLFSPFISLIS